MVTMYNLLSIIRNHGLSHSLLLSQHVVGRSSSPKASTVGSNSLKCVVLNGVDFIVQGVLYLTISI